MSNTSVVDAQYPRISRDSVIRILRDGECGDPAFFEAHSHKWFAELCESATKREVYLVLEEKPDGTGKEVVFISKKGCGDLLVPSRRKRLCEIGRWYTKTKTFVEKFYLFGIRETELRLEGPVQALIRGFTEEAGIHVLPQQLTEPLHRRHPIEAQNYIEDGKSSVWWNVRSRSFCTTRELALSEMPMHPPFGERIVPLWDGSVCSVCEWLDEEEAQERYFEEYVRRLLKREPTRR